MLVIEILRRAGRTGLGTNPGRRALIQQGGPMIRMSPRTTLNKEAHIPVYGDCNLIGKTVERTRL